jgi:hypothetical protein
LVPGELIVDSTVTALEPQRLVQYGWHDKAGADDGVQVRWELAPDDAGTRLVFTETFPRTLAEADDVSGRPAEMAAWCWTGSRPRWRAGIRTSQRRASRPTSTGTRVHALAFSR